MAYDPDETALVLALASAGGCSLNEKKGSNWVEEGGGLLDAARAICDAHALSAFSGTTSAHLQVVVLRVLAPNVEPAMGLLGAVWQRWRAAAWRLEPSAPRVWRT